LLTEFINLVISFRRHMSTSSGKLANKIKNNILQSVNEILYVIKQC